MEKGKENWGRKESSKQHIVFKSLAFSKQCTYYGHGILAVDFSYKIISPRKDVFPQIKEDKGTVSTSGIISHKVSRV